MWNKRGLAGLRAELLRLVDDKNIQNAEDASIVSEIALTVYRTLPTREWDKANKLIYETCGLLDINCNDWSTEIMRVQLTEETLREEIGDEMDD